MSSFNEDKNFLLCNIEHNKKEIEKREKSIERLKAMQDAHLHGQRVELYRDKFLRQIDCLKQDNDDMEKELKRRERK